MIPEEPIVNAEFRDDGSIPNYEEFDRMVLEECGYDADNGVGKRIFESVIAESDEEKIFTIRDSENTDDKLKQSFNIDNTVYEILKNPSFDEYWRKTILENLDTERDKLLLEQVDDAFIGDEVYRKLNELGKLEVFYYIDFFREILAKTENDEAMKLVELDDKAFKEMPNVMRIY